MTQAEKSYHMVKALKDYLQGKSVADPVGLMKRGRFESGGDIPVFYVADCDVRQVGDMAVALEI